jgi:diguanylate cyclase (GGDEF)-like protein
MVPRAASQGTVGHMANETTPREGPTAEHASSRIPDDIDVPTYVVRTVLAVAGAYVIARATLATWAGTPLTWWWVPLEAIVAVVLVGVAIVAACAVPIRRDLDAILGRAADNERALREGHRSQVFLRDVQHAFEMVEREDELYVAAGFALREAGPAQAEILVADASNAHVNRLAVADDRPAPACGVTTPHQCPAVRQGHTLKFDDPNGLASCPRLRERHLAEGSRAVCVPINVLGTPAAVLHAVCDCTTDPREAEFGVRALEGVAVRFGQRLGMMRAMAKSQHQADTDPLTGLLNRRAMETQVRSLQMEGVPFSVAMLDLDHFKHLNDTFGHETGDRALRLFTRALRSALRDDDVVARYGGEEFVVILPNTDIAAAAPAMHRVRHLLQTHLATAEVPSFTCSIGLVDSGATTDLTTLLRRADQALMDAKRQGRDRIVIADTDTEMPIDTIVRPDVMSAPDVADADPGADPAIVRPAHA